MDNDISRRTILTAWSVPVIAMTVTASAASASTTGPGLPRLNSVRIDTTSSAPFLDVVISFPIDSVVVFDRSMFTVDGVVPSAILPNSSDPTIWTVTLDAPWWQSGRVLTVSVQGFQGETLVIP